MKDFGDFVALLTPETLEKIRNNVSFEIEKILSKDLPVEELSLSVDYARSISSAVEILGLYHEWLNQ